jgi:hypothetical protein
VDETVSVDIRVASRAYQLGVEPEEMLRRGYVTVVADWLAIDELTAGAQDAIARAREIAHSLGHDYVGTEHLLLALSEDSGGVAGHALALRIHGEAVLAELRRILATPSYSASTPWEGKKGG